VTVPDKTMELLRRGASLVPEEVRADWQELVDRTIADVWDRPVLAARQRSIITIAGLATLVLPTELRTQVRLARANGMTRLEICEVVMQIAGYAGAGRALEAMQVLREVFEEEGEAAAPETKPDGSWWPPLEGRHDRARITINKLQPHQGDLIHAHAGEYEVDGGPDRTPISPISGGMGWIHANAFGDLWCRPHLADEERERATTAALVVLRMGVELRGHFEANVSFGFTPEEIGEGILQLAPYVGYPTTVHAMLLAGEVIRTFTPPDRARSAP
jgi:4-carboxymuconolactone decarboxylase